MYIVNYHHLSFYYEEYFLTVCCYFCFLFIHIILNKILPQSKTMNFYQGQFLRTKPDSCGRGPLYSVLSLRYTEVSISTQF